MNMGDDHLSNRKSGDEDEDRLSHRGTIWRRDSIDLDPFVDDGNSDEDFQFDEDFGPKTKARHPNLGMAGKRLSKVNELEAENENFDQKDHYLGEDDPSFRQKLIQSQLNDIDEDATLKQKPRTTIFNGGMNTNEIHLAVNKERDLN